MDTIPDELLSELAKDTSAMQRFAGLPDSEKDEVKAQARSARSGQEVERIVSRL